MKKSYHIHPTAIIAPGVTLGENVTIEPYVVINSPHVVIEDNVVIKSHAYIDGYTTIGAGTTIYPSASIGTKTQDLKYKGEKTFVKIGKNCDIREFVTINSSCQEGSVVEVGDNCLIMAYCHIAHNCVVGNRVIMSNNATLAGHVIVEDCAVIGGMTPIHQFVRIGRYAMVGGMSRVTHDIPPYTIGAGIPYKFGGLNIIGLKRHGFPLETRQELSKAFKLLYRSQLHINEALNYIEQELKPLPEIQHFIQFCRQTRRGLMGLQGAEEELPQMEEEEPDLNLLLALKAKK
ncbi:acyl-ACP--UDP-N-acetylglucosamine O-acyltransferase [Candidatus Protochlamydia phocaeensis]|uniref:acyl-ACP--UDP-N-acetylglucosamine O-acyltransferase n=1 Tax=Candidatus Protochlamydia phocaeensis TaxID=1414722 RepID=UPI000837FC32|nr:acyl-ACP--UDP-N-acetylglucosamine O-acyltransferase [Candidatus Protochlamydia phocaeensis]